jgi:DNA mismatch repair protein MutL
MESSEGLVILDFRAAWERIFFEDARLKASRQTPTSQRLLVPITLQLGPREFDFMKRHLGLLQNLGIGAEEFGAQTLKIDALPASLGHSEKTDALLHQLIDDLLHAQEKTALHRLDLDGIAAIVSSQAARLKIPGDLREIDEVVSQLLGCEMPYCCPVGRATLIQLSHSELARKFGKR